jgi:hypothetical protein
MDTHNQAYIEHFLHFLLHTLSSRGLCIIWHGSKDGFGHKIGMFGVKNRENYYMDIARICN